MPDQLILPELQDLIFTTLEEAEAAQFEARQHESMVKDILINDEEYHAIDTEVKNGIEKRKAKKAKVIGAGNAFTHVIRAKELRRKARALKASAGKNMVKYAEKSGDEEIEDTDGNLYSIIPTAKLKKTIKQK